MVKTLNVIKDRQNDASKLPIPGELADGRFADLSNPPSLAALKLHAVLFKAAGGKVADDCWHQISLAALRSVSGMRNVERRGLLDLLKELRAAVLEYDTADDTVIGGLLAIGRVHFEAVERGRAPAMMRWKFDDGFREVVAKSNYWALIDRQTAMRMTSRYSLRLLEIMSVRFNLDHKVKETFSIADLRARLAVPDGKLKTWDHFQARAINPAVAEVNQLSRFIVTARPVKDGRAVAAVEFSWSEKAAAAVIATKRELERHKSGRKARRDGTVETVIAAELIAAARSFPPFPALGSIRYTPWEAIARAHYPAPLPDLEWISDRFRQWCAKKQPKPIPLTAANLQKSFESWCEQGRPAK